MSDVVVIGGGVIGLTVAWELAGQGIAVTLLDQGALGTEASWAGAGILPPGNLVGAKTPEARLRGASCALWSDLSAELRELTGIDNGYRRCGGIEAEFDGASPRISDEIAGWREDGLTVEAGSAEDLHRWEPALHPEIAGGYRLPELAQVRNPRHVKALIAGCAARGVRLCPGQPALGFERRGERVVSVRTPGGLVGAERFCIAGGAWTGSLLSPLGCELPVVPVRGQIVLLVAQPLPFRHVIQQGPRYLVPRPDGRVLIGSTEEHVGFEKANTAEAVQGLIAFGTRMVPSLRGARFERAWSGLRPGSPDGLPYLGRVPETENVFVAAGHFRSGLQMSPGTGRVMRQVMFEEEPMISLDGFCVDRALSPR